MSNNKGELKEKVVKVAIIKSNKLTLTEITALANKIIENVNAEVVKHNSSFRENTKFKAEVKKLKTKTGVLSAEKAILFLKEKHNKVDIVVKSYDYDKQYKDLEKKYIKRSLNSWNDSQDLKSIKNELILSQVTNANMLQVAESITKKLITI